VILLPLRDDNPVRRVPWVTGLLVLANVVAFGWELSEGLPIAVQEFGLVPARFVGAFSTETAPAWSTLFTSMFLHGNLLHLAGNLIYLWVFGNNVEEVLGSLRYLAFYLAAGLGAHAAHLAASGMSPVPTVGASGAISGILAAYLLRFPRARVHSLLFLFVFLRWVRLPASVVIGYWLVLQVVNGVAELGGAGPTGIAWFEHLGGFATGAALYFAARFATVRA
jgi:membrane associated rhomboid family serine protease